MKRAGYQKDALTKAALLLEVVLQSKTSFSVKIFFNKLFLGCDPNDYLEHVQKHLFSSDSFHLAASKDMGKIKQG